MKSYSSWLLALGSWLFLAGCVGDHRNSQQNQFPAFGPGTVALPQNPPSAGSAVVPDRAGLPANSSGQPNGISDLRAEMTASNNAAQQSLTGLGLQVGKVAEKLEGVHAEMRAELNSSVSAQASANANLTSTIRAELSATITNQAKVDASAIADLRAEFKADLRAQAAAQADAAVGIANKINSMQSTVTAGRDAIQFTPEMARLLAYGVAGAVATIVALCCVLAFALECSRRRAEGRASGIGNRASGAVSDASRDTAFIRKGNV